MSTMHLVTKSKGKFAYSVISIQIVFLLIFAFFVDYDATAKPTNWRNGISDSRKTEYIDHYFSFFQDIHAMIFFGIGFLLTFMKKYGYTGVGMNMFLAAFSIQTGILIQNVWNIGNGKIHINLESLIWSDFAAASALIALGAILGKVSILQMVVFTIFETVFYAVNEHLCFELLKVADVGEAVALHLFAAVFGLSVAFVVDWKRKVRDNSNEGHSYNSDIFCMIGTVFLWAFWPTFNSALSTSDLQHRSAINTFLALVASCITAFAMSSYMNKNQKFEMAHIQNSTLAGGVAISTTANLMIHPTGALAIGGIAGILSVAGFNYLPEFLAKHAKIYDPCGIHSLHAIPGFFGGLTGAALALTASETIYGNSLYTIYPAMTPTSNGTTFFETQSGTHLISITDRSPLMQAGFQLIYIAVTIAFSVITGLLTGLFLRLPVFDSLEEKDMYIDDVFWDIPKEKITEFNKSRPLNDSKY